VILSRIFTPLTFGPDHFNIKHRHTWQDQIGGKNIVTKPPISSAVKQQKHGASLFFNALKYLDKRITL